jgi:hypothetical protein
MGYRILSRSKHEARHGVWSHKIYATRESAKKAYDRFYTGKYAKYKKYDVSVKIVKAKKPQHDIFGGAFRGF